MLEGNEVTDELTRKGAAKSLYEPDPYCEVENGFMATTLEEEEERLRKLYWTNLTEIE